MVVRVFSALVALALSLSPASSVARNAVSSQMPAIDADFPDPAVLRAPDGYYYAYATQTERDGKWVNLQVARSRDLKHWTWIGDALPVKPGWASTTQDFWAPDVIHDGKTYYMYYSAKPDNSDERHGLCLAIATSSRPQGPFQDTGRPLQCGEGFVNIDPMAFDDEATGKKLLYWGSGFQPIKVQELAADRLSFAPGSSPRNLVWPNPVKDQFPVLVEGPWVIRHGSWYYLFYSGDNCCGVKANYAVMIARSRSATGPFQTLEQVKGVRHSIIVGKDNRWIAPGHNSVITDNMGRTWILYHAVDANRPRARRGDEVNTRRVMLVRPIVWRHGWPGVSD